MTKLIDAQTISVADFGAAKFRAYNRCNENTVVPWNVAYDAFTKRYGRHPELVIDAGIIWLAGPIDGWEGDK